MVFHLIHLFIIDAAGRLLSEQSDTGTLQYAYDALDNLTTLTLPDGRQLNHLYYGSGHLHQINLNGRTICDFERDVLHRETLRTQGDVTSQFGYDSKGRRIWQTVRTAQPPSRTVTTEPGRLLL